MLDRLHRAEHHQQRIDRQQAAHDPDAEPERPAQLPGRTLLLVCREQLGLTVAQLGQVFLPDTALQGLYEPVTRFGNPPLLD